VFKYIAIVILALTSTASLLAACNSQPIPPTVNPDPITTEVTPGPDGEDSPIPDSATPTQVREERVLKICTGSEPASLFPFGSLSTSARSILQAIYDGPVDEIGFQPSPVILHQIPSIENGEAFFEPVQVMPGDVIVDNSGEPGNLREGTVYRPSGCRGPECAATFSGAGPAQMDSLVVRFRLLPGLRWSDGFPLTARDSEYAYQVAQAVYPAYRPELLRLTYSYKSIDETGVEWRGLPGSQPPQYAQVFFPPLPEQAWQDIPVSQLTISEASQRSPVGWGPYLLEEWVPGESIHLTKNIHYFRSDQGLPYFDRLVFKFTATSQEATRAVLEGECDLADEASLSRISVSGLQALRSETNLIVHTQPGGGWEQILFGISPWNEDQPAVFRSPQVRQAVAACIDREGIISELYPDLTFVPDSLLSPDHPLYYPEVSRYPYDPQSASEMLTASGWIDHDNDWHTPRLAQGVPGIQDGTPFEFTYLASNDAERERSASMVVEYLAECGIQANLSFAESSHVYAGGPDGPVFGRQFDAAQLAWMTFSELPCTLFSSNEIPGPYPASSKGWGGANAGGFSDQNFDQACRTRHSILADDPAMTAASHQLQGIFSEQLPALPLYMHLRVAASRPDLCGFQMDPSNPNSLWNLEELDYGGACQP
jgi:peptide/nickel transport system substrate-binding protein